MSSDIIYLSEEEYNAVMEARKELNEGFNLFGKSEYKYNDKLFGKNIYIDKRTKKEIDKNEDAKKFLDKSIKFINSNKDDVVEYVCDKIDCDSFRWYSDFHISIFHNEYDDSDMTITAYVGVLPGDAKSMSSYKYICITADNTGIDVRKIYE